MPRLMAPPGGYSQYSNFGIAALGILIEDLTGSRLEDYFAANIYRPLGFTKTVLWYSHEPTDDVGITSMFYPNGDTVALKHSGIHPVYAPAGNLYSTLDDMGRYLIAHLDAGRTTSSALLSAGMFELMHTAHVRNHPLVSGFGMAFFTETWNGVRTVSHGGSYPGYHSYLVLFPEHDAGIFVSAFTQYPQAGLWEQLATAVMSTRLTPSGPQAGYPITGYNFREMIYNQFLGPRRPSPSAADRPLDEYLGTYVNPQHNYSRAQSILTLLGGSLSVGRHPDGGLRVGRRGPYVMEQPDFFTYASNPDGDPFIPNPDRFAVAFTRDSAGAVNGMSVPLSLGVFLRVGRLADPGVHFRFASIALVICLTGLLALGWPRRGAAPGRWPLLLAALSTVLLGAMLITMIGPGRGGDPMPDLELGHLWSLGLAVLAAHLLVLGGGFALWLALSPRRRTAWGSGKRAAARRVHSVIVGAAALSLIPLFLHYHVLGVQLP
jgi:hypothetical protein